MAFILLTRVNIWKRERNNIIFYILLTKVLTGASRRTMGSSSPGPHKRFGPVIPWPLTSANTEVFVLGGTHDG